MPPLVSIMLPCFNAGESLPMALASVRAQSLSDWECVCVDDGSTDRTPAMLEAVAAGDSRFRLERFATNRGRGAARQRALELARGRFLAFLDADDWMYPERLEREAGWLAADQSLVGVTASAAVTEGTERMVGVMRPRAAGDPPLIASFARPRPPRWVFPSSMVVTAAARQAGFDPGMRRSQDSDFLVRLLLGRRYGASTQVLYAYSQGSAATLGKTLEGYRFRVRSHLRHVARFPLSVSYTVAETLAKALVYSTAGLLGMDRLLIERRWSSADRAALQAFERALDRVRRAMHELLEGPLRAVR